MKKGILCPVCKTPLRGVVYTRPRQNTIVRRRDCKKCGEKVITVEENADNVYEDTPTSR